MRGGRAPHDLDVPAHKKGRPRASVRGVGQSERRSRRLIRADMQGRMREDNLGGPVIPGGKGVRGGGAKKPMAVVRQLAWTRAEIGATKVVQKRILRFLKDISGDGGAIG